MHYNCFQTIITVCQHMVDIKSAKSIEMSNFMKTKVINVKVTNNFSSKNANCTVFNKARNLKSEHMLAQR